MQDDTTDETVKKKRFDYPEQKIDGDPGATGDYAAKCKQDFRMCLQRIFFDIASEVYNGNEGIAEKHMDSAMVCFNRYFQSMKGGVNLTGEDMKVALAEEERRQNRLYSALRELSQKFMAEGVRFEIVKPGYYHRETLWNTGLSAGCLIRTAGDIPLYAFPLLPVHTADYLVPRSGPIAAQLIFLNDSCILFMPYDEDPGDTFWNAAGKIFGEPDDITGQIPAVHSALLYQNHLALNVLEIISITELETLRNRYKVLAVLHGDPHDFKAFLYIGKEDQLPRLIQEFLNY